MVALAALAPVLAVGAGPNRLRSRVSCGSASDRTTAAHSAGRDRDSGQQDCGGGWLEIQNLNSPVCGIALGGYTVRLGTQANSEMAPKMLDGYGLSSTRGCLPLVEYLFHLT